MNKTLTEKQIKDSLIGVKIIEITKDETGYPLIHCDKETACDIIKDRNLTIVISL